jgi:hypothetical protein
MRVTWRLGPRLGTESHLPNWWKWDVVWWRTSAFASSALMAPYSAQLGILQLPALTEQRFGLFVL